MKIKRKNLKIPLVLLALIVIGIFFIFAADFSGGREQKWGVTFSKSYALDLQLDWQETYLAILDDLKVSQIRLGAYWNEIEKQKDKYDFRELDWQVQEATKRNVEMVLVIGRRLPRCPECHQPDGVKSASYQQNNAEVLQLLEILVNRYKNNYKITAWQIENEPLFAWFGDCPAPN